MAFDPNTRLVLDMRNAKFPLGRVAITPGAAAELSVLDVGSALMRHFAGDWGELDEHDVWQNEQSLWHGARLFSRYKSGSGQPFYIITEHDRSVTTILLPEEY